MMNERLHDGRRGRLVVALVAVIGMLGAMAWTGPGGATAPPAAASAPAHTDVLVLHLFFQNAAERDRLAVEWGAEEADTRSGYLTIWGDATIYQAMLAQHLHVEIDQALSDQINSRQWFGQNSPDTFYGGFKTVEEMQTFLDQEVAAHPTLAVKVDLGPGWCASNPGACTLPAPYSGYHQYALHITNQAIPGPKPVYWYEAGIHAREIAVPEIAADYISWLLDGYNSDPDAHWLVDWQDIWVVPMTNPDGHHIVEAGGGGSSPYYQRKNANNTNGCTTWPPNISNQFGVDNNRNFSFLWNCCGGSSGAACGETYHGTGAASEPETQNVINAVRALIPDQRGPNITDAAPLTATGVFQDMHSNASLNLYAWGMYAQPSPNNAETANIGQHLSAGNAGPPGNGYPACQPARCLYAVDGDSIDWAYGELGAASFTTEVGGSDFLVPLSYVQNTLWPANRGALIYQAKIARTPYLLAHGPDANAVATNPMTVTQGTPVQLTATINFAWTGNAFAQNVGAAEYYVDTPPWAGGAAAPMSGSFGGSQTVAVQATIDTSSLAPGRHVIFVRGRGVNDVQGFRTWGAMSAAFLQVNPPAGTPTPTVTGTPPTATPTRTATETPSATPTPCALGVVQNSGFETGSFAPWVIRDTNPTPTVRTGTTHSGTYAAFVGSDPGAEPNGNSSFYQQITVPAAGGTLSFWWDGYTEDSVTYDWQDAYVTDTSGNILATIMHVAQTTGSFTQKTYDMSAFAGQTVRIEFLVHQDGFGDVTNMYVDDVDIVGACGTPEPTNTPAPETPTGTVTPTPSPGPPTATPPPTDTPGVPTTTPTGTAVVPTSTPGPGTPTVPPATATTTGVPPTATPPPGATDTATPPPGATATATPPPGATGTATPPGATGTATPAPSETPCGASFNDVHPTDYFYQPVLYLACRGVISGYSDGTFRPYNATTRAQMVKIVVLGFGLPIVTPTGTAYTFADVPRDHPFFAVIETAADSGIVSGYDCGGLGEPCDPQHRPYFRPYANVTRGQLSKIVVVAAGWDLQNPPDRLLRGRAAEHGLLHLRGDGCLSRHHLRL